MANKRYDEFPAGTYDTAKIFLQADSATGELEKVNLPTIPAVPLPRLSDVASANNSGSNPQTLATLTIPANTLNTDGDVIKIYCVWQMLTGSGTKVVTVAFGGTTIISRTRTGAGNHIFYLTLTRSDSTHYILNGYDLETTAIFTTVGPTVNTFDPTIANDITAVVTSGIANDIKYWQIYAELLTA